MLMSLGTKIGKPALQHYLLFQYFSSNEFTLLCLPDIGIIIIIIIIITVVVVVIIIIIIIIIEWQNNPKRDFTS